MKAKRDYIFRGPFWDGFRSVAKWMIPFLFTMTAWAMWMAVMQ